MKQEATTVAAGTAESIELANLIRRNVESMAFPPSKIEAATYEEVSALPRVVVSRPPAEELLATGFVPYDCHRNCGEQAANDPDGKSRQVTGWLPHGEDLILHSVAIIENQWICLTPQLVPAPNRFEFIPDLILSGAMQMAAPPGQHSVMGMRYRRHFAGTQAVISVCGTNSRLSSQGDIR
ncbi:hypothetical protein [Mesorhizobium sp. M0037]|uniref:hypothetical protein n=1 Tax=unclassified Mesorhizobium TaxID=325217 RepID=UPI00333ACD09